MSEVRNDIARLEGLKARRIKTLEDNRAAAEQKHLARIFQKAQGAKLR